MSDHKSHSRRAFIRKLGGTTALVAGATTAFGANSFKEEILQQPKRFSPNDKIRIAGIGMGIMGFGDVKTALQVPGTELVAVCDLYDGRLTRSKEIFGKSVFTTRDYQQILNRKDIDAVIVATTDHWHDQISIDAMNKGKAVYCEKPMVHQIAEGHAVIAAQQKTKKPLQVGSQRISSLTHAKAREFYRAGAIGELNMVEAVMDRSDANGAWQYSIPPDASPKTIDWDRFIGDAPKVPFDPVRFFRWRNYRDYGTGVPGDLFVHLITGLHYIVDSKGPIRIFSSGQLAFWKDGRDVPDVVVAIFDYPKTETHPAFQMTLRVNFVDGGGGGSHTRMIGSEGVMELGWSDVKLKRNKISTTPTYGGWDSFETFPEAVQKEFVRNYQTKYGMEMPKRTAPREEVYKEPQGFNDRYEHFVNFFDAVRTGKPVIEDPAFGLRAAGPALASNMSYFEKKIINWDPENMKVTNM